MSLQSYEHLTGHARLLGVENTLYGHGLAIKADRLFLVLAGLLGAVSLGMALHERQWLPFLAVSLPSIALALVQVWLFAGTRLSRVHQWDGKQWKVISDWVLADRALLRPIIETSSKAYAKEKGITPRDCSKES